MTNDKINSGVPRPYASTTLATPKQVIKRIVSPYKVWEVIVFGIAFTVIGLLYLIWHAGETYSSTLLSFGGVFATVAIGVGFWNNTEEDVREVPSIGDVSRTIEYVRAASRLSVFTILGGLFTVFLLAISHTSNAFYFIDDSTRLSVIVLMAIAFTSSYLIVRTLCSYTPAHNRTKLSLPVEVSSVPEILTIIGFILSPILVIIAGLVYNGPPIVEVPFSVTIVDTIAILMVMLFIYLSAVSKLN